MVNVDYEVGSHFSFLSHIVICKANQSPRPIRSSPDICAPWIRSSSETQGQWVGLGEKAQWKFLSMGGKTLGYRLSSDHFITVKQMLAPDWPQKMLCIIVPNRANSISWVLILDSQIKSSLDIHAPRIRSSRYSWPLDQIIEIFATPRSNHPQIFVPPDQIIQIFVPPGSDHPDIRSPRSNHPQIFLLPGAGHPDIHNPWSDHPQLFGTHLFISWWLEPNFHQRLFEKLVSHRLFILLCYGNNWKWLPPFLV